MQVTCKKLIKETLVPIKWAINGVVNLMLSLRNLNSIHVAE